MRFYASKKHISVYRTFSLLISVIYWMSARSLMRLNVMFKTRQKLFRFYMKMSAVYGA